MLAIHHAVGRWRGARQAQAHVEHEAAQRGLFRREHGAHLRAGHHAPRARVRVAEDQSGRAFRHRVGGDPCRVAPTQHESPRAVAAGMHDHDALAGKQRALLEAVDVVVVGVAEHAQRGRECAQVRAAHDEAVAQRLRSRDRVEGTCVEDRRDRFRRDRLAAHVVERPIRRAGQRLDPSLHLRARQCRGQGIQVVHRGIFGEQARVARVDRGAVQQDAIRLRRARDPEFRIEAFVGDRRDAAEWRRRIARDRGGAGEQQAGGEGEATEMAHQGLPGSASRDRMDATTRPKPVPSA